MLSPASYMESNVTNASGIYSCYEGRLISNVSITSDFWDIPERARPAALSTAVFTLAFIVVGLPGNLLIILSILWQRLYKEPTHILLLNLAIADLLVCVLVMPFTVISGFAGSFILGGSDSTKCKWCTTAVIFVALCLFSLHMLALMSVDRFIFVKFPMRYHRIMTARKSLCCVLVLWFLCITVSLFPIFGFGDVFFGLSVSTCSIRTEEATQVTKNLYYFVFLVVIAIFPLSVLVATNTWVICIVQKQIRSIYYTVKKSLPKDQEQVTANIRRRLNKERNNKQLQLMRVFGAILLSNVLTWLPLIVRIVITAIKGNDEFPIWVYVFVYLCISFTAVSHPLIQASLLPEVRTSCKHFIAKAVCWWKTADRPHSSDSRCRKAKVISSTNSVIHLGESTSKSRCFCLEVLGATVLPTEELDSPV